MEEETHPELRRMEVSGEGELELRGGTQKTAGPQKPRGPRRSPEAHAQGEATSGCMGMDLAQLARQSLEGLQSGVEGPHQRIPMASLKTSGTSRTSAPHSPPLCRRVPSQPRVGTAPDVRGAGGEALPGAPVAGMSAAPAPPGRQVARPPPPQSLQIQMTCIQGLKDKVPPGAYFLRVSLLRHLGGPVLPWGPSELLEARTRAVRHEGNFYDLGLDFQERLCVVLPPGVEPRPGLAFLFELLLHRGTLAPRDRVVGWAAFPACDNNFNMVEGNFKCPLLRGRYDQTVNHFRKMEDWICQDLDHWLCNLYFQVIKLPLHSEGEENHGGHTRPPPEFPVCLTSGAEKAAPAMNREAGLLGGGAQKGNRAPMGDDSQSSRSRQVLGKAPNKISPSPTRCDVSLSEEDRDLHGEEEDVSGASGKEHGAAWGPGEPGYGPLGAPSVEVLGRHSCAVRSPPVTDGHGSREFLKHLHFLWMSVFYELELAQWRSRGFWYLLLLAAALWFLRLFLHYLGQCLFLRAISAPVTKLHFSAHTAELHYPATSLDAGEELLVVAVGALAPSLAIPPLLLGRWGWQLLSMPCPPVLSQLIITTGLWAVLDPWTVLVVDAFLGRLAGSGEPPVGDAAKLYWAFVRSSRPGLLGVVVTVILYLLLLVISSLILYLYCLRLHSDSWVADAFQRIHSEEATFFMPFDGEISNQELSLVVKRAEQWRGTHGERRKVAVYDYIWSSRGGRSGASICDLQHQEQAAVPAQGPGDVTSHVAITTVYPSGVQLFFRHFLRLPSGAIVEVFGDVRDLSFVHSDVLTALQDRIKMMNRTLEESSGAKSRGRKMSIEI